jgi:CIC family chloride channel protein
MNNIWNQENKKNFRVLFFSLIIGIITGLLGTLFRSLLSLFENYRTKIFLFAHHSDILHWVWPILFAVSSISIALFLVKKFATEASGSGVQEIEGALDETRPMRWKRVIPVKFIASIFSLGSGLLLGREGPTIQLGANIGHMIKEIFKQPEFEDNPLVSAGAAAGLASAFNAPFAGIIFVIEEMHGHFKFNFFSVAAVMIGSATADFIVRALIGSNPVIEMLIFSGYKLASIEFFFILGLLLGAVGLLYNKLLIAGVNIFEKTSKFPIILIGSVVGLIIAVGGILFPDLIGGGYDTISAVLKNSFSLSFLLVLFGIRLFLSVFSYGTGAPGGIFAPLLTLGLILGMAYGTSMQFLFPQLINQPIIFAVAGIAGLFASTVRAPLTGLVLAVEMTSNFELILPLLITTATASVFTTVIGNQPIYTTLLKRTLDKENPQRKDKY